RSLGGGGDASGVGAWASRARGAPPPPSPTRAGPPTPDETARAPRAARHVGTEPVVVRYGAAEVLANYPRLVHAAEGPVVDTSCAALLLLAQEVRARGYKVALTGEGADEWLAGYPWYKLHRLLGWLDLGPGLPRR